MTMPPLLMIAEGRKPRPRKAPISRPREIELHRRTAATLRKLARPDWQWWHTPNGERRDGRTAAKLKAMGVRPGVPDFMLIGPDGAARLLELKREGEALSDAQLGFKLWAIRHGVAYVVAENFSHVMTALQTWGAVIETGGHSDE